MRIELGFGCKLCENCLVRKNFTDVTGPEPDMFLIKKKKIWEILKKVFPRFSF